MSDLGLSLPVGSQCIGSVNVAMFHHHSWELDGETWGERAGRCLPSPCYSAASRPQA